MSADGLERAIEAVSPGRWAVGVSGGADSVALLLLLRARTDLSLHVVHLDHQTRGQASTDDARFVQDLRARLQLQGTVELRERVEQQLPALPSNPSARYRAARTELFRQVVAEHGLAGVILGHHADDQAETVLQRLIRGTGPNGLSGMNVRTCLGGLLILRPLLSVRREDLRQYLRDRGQEWREDASNLSDKYLRNRLRQWLAEQPALHEGLIELAQACRGLRKWATGAAPRLEESFAARELAQLPTVLARQSARRWLLSQGAHAGELTERVLDRLIEMTADAASAPRQQFPGALAIRRRGGVVFAEERGPSRGPPGGERNE